MQTPSDPRHPQRQDTFDLREQITTETRHSEMQAHADAASHHYNVYGTEDEDGGGYSVLEHESDGEEDQDQDGVMYEDDLSSELSIPDESINFDLVYSLHSFAATVEGQANVVKGDSLILMDDSNSYWWLVKVLKTQEVGYIPAENIETPFERLARLNKHRNVDLASATEQEKEDGQQDHLRIAPGSHPNRRKTPSPRLVKAKSVLFNASFPVHRYLPAVWNEDEEDEDDNMEWDDVEYIGEDPDLAIEEREREIAAMEALTASGSTDASMDEAAAAQWNQEMTIEQIQVLARARKQQQKGQLPDGVQQQQQPQQQPQQQSPREIILQRQAEQQGIDARKGLGTPTREIGNERGTPEPTVSASGAMEKQQQQLLQQQHQQSKSQEDAILRTSAKRPAEEEAALASEEAKKRARDGKDGFQRQGAVSPVSTSSSHSGTGKLRKEPKDRDKSRGEGEDDESGSGKKKKSSVLRSLFGWKDKDKDKERSKTLERGGSIGSLGSMGSMASQDSNEKEDNLRPQRSTTPGSIDQSQFSTPDRPTAPSHSVSQALSPHANQLRQRDMQQQALYQQYLNRSPSSPPEAQPSYGLQSASALMTSSAFRTSSASPGGTTSPVLNASLSMSSNASTATNASTGTTTSSTSNASNASTTATLGPPSTPRQRPGSLILISGSGIADGQGPGVPDLSVIRVFAGRNLQTEATFKTVLLNSSTTAAELVRQAIQRFRLPEGSESGGHSTGSAASGNGSGGEEPGAGGGSAGEYYLTVKRVEGGASAILRPNEKPLVVFETLVMQAMQEEADALEAGLDEEAHENGLSNLPPRVKRSSVCSISSLASNLSMHPAIRKLPMNDFTDDSAVRYYLNRRTMFERDRNTAGAGGGYSTAFALGAGIGGEGGGAANQGYKLYEDDEVEDHTLMAETSNDELSFSPNFGLGEGDISISSTTSSLGMEIPSSFGVVGAGQGQGSQGGLRYLANVAGSNVPPERFSSPSLRFAVQLIIHPGDLPDDMAFHPFTEAIVPRENLLASSSGKEGAASPAVFRRKVFMFPKNVTVAEVIELGLERFGILEGVVDGGDEVEDKLAKRRSTSRVRYSLCVDTGNGQEKELSPTSKVIEAFPRQPTLKAQVPNSKRRSVDSANLLGNLEDVSLDDPVFILRRATAYRNLSSRRMSAPLDEIALQHLHHQRDSTASSTGSDTAGEEGSSKSKGGAPSRQEIIAAQRAATRANQRAILSAQTNSVRGVDLLLPNNAVLRSSRYDASDRMRYSYVEPDGETYDISDIVGEEWREHGRQDVLAGVVGKNRIAGDSEKLDRVLNKIKNGKRGGSHSSQQSTSSRSKSSSSSSQASTIRRRMIPKDDFGIDHMMAVIECKAAMLNLEEQDQKNSSPTGSSEKQPSSSSTTTTTTTPPPSSSQMNLMFKTGPLPPLDPVDAILFGRPIDVESLHPSVREIYSSAFQQLEEMDKVMQRFAVWLET
ncbi:hypothetical protein M378DRAFT_200701 [Amanita muscaria Koide BX008]|uniref:SH3 domain-containing protein n=1 Tax=Amanita muscaria (strain Koide BX008) TaxID=946122 RepID=A0A0C2WND9_AMAMK|nr:hypothetical protein M378DRAFT_200701 [Amanita muscaria Koide BX008]